MTRMTKTEYSVAQLVELMIDYSGKTQLEICKEAGLKSANFLSMIKTGRAKLPVNRIPALAKACGTDPVPLLIVALKEYQPEILGVLERVLDLPKISSTPKAGPALTRRMSI